MGKPAAFQWQHNTNHKNCIFTCLPKAATMWREQGSVIYARASEPKCGRDPLRAAPLRLERKDDMPGKRTKVEEPVHVQAAEVAPKRRRGPRGRLRERTARGHGGPREVRPGVLRAHWLQGRPDGARAARGRTSMPTSDAEAVRQPVIRSASSTMSASAAWVDSRARRREREAQTQTEKHP